MYTPPTNKTITISLVLLTLLALSSCLQTQIQQEPPTPPAQSITPTQAEPESGAVYYPDEHPTTCAQVTAYALHLRDRDTADARIIGWLTSGDIVTVLSTANPDWWRISANEQIGYARSTYLEKADCK